MSNIFADRRFRHRATSNFRTLSIGAVLVASSASSVLAVDQLHERTSPDAFMRVQYTSKAEFIEGLKHHPNVLKAMAKSLGTNPSRLLQYIHDELHLGRLQTTRRYMVWGLHQGRVYRTHVRYQAGTPAWVTADGTPVICWRCSNPMMDHLQTVASRPEAVVTPRPEPVVTPPPVEPPAVVVTPPEPVVTPPPVEPPAVVVTPPPVVIVTPPPAVVVTPPPAVVVTPPEIIELENRRRIGIKVGATTWTNSFGTNKTLVTAGADFDLLTFSNTHLALYFDAAGVFEKHSPYRWYGGGLELRHDLGDPSNSLSPYVGLGVGYYTGHINDFFATDFNKLGGKAFVGLQSHGGLFLELQYNQLGHEVGRDLSRFGLSLGYRF